MSSLVLTIPVKRSKASRIEVSLAGSVDRSHIYQLRHQIYALELGQHHANRNEQLTDGLDAYNIYFKASVGERMAGFVSITPPGRRYSVDKYFARDVFPFPFDGGLYEVRLLTVIPEYRRKAIASLLMYAALRWIEAHGGTRVVAIGRREVLSLYCKAGLQLLGRSTQSGAVNYELMSATVKELRENADQHRDVLGWLKSRVDWRLDIPFTPIAACRHGGDSFQAIGEDFDDLSRSSEIINADVLDAWFPPSPKVVAVLREHLPFLIRTAPPTDCAGFVRAISRVRGVPEGCVVPAAGSSELIFLAFRDWLNRESRVLLLDPSYGEYAHVTERVVGCHVDRLALRREENYQLDPATLVARITAGEYNLFVIVNPNSPTGQHIPRTVLERILRQVPAQTRVWIDETYVDYVGAGESLESFAAASQNVVVCKSMSKVYALSGVRAAYLCCAPEIAARLREISPPWAVSLPAQVAAVRALEDSEYYAECYRETHRLRASLAEDLREMGIEVHPSMANFLLCHLPDGGPEAGPVARRCRDLGVYLRDAGEISPLLGSRALRIAVKDERSNCKIRDVLGKILAGSTAL